MDPNKMPKVPSELALTAILSSGLTIVMSVTYTVLCILALVYRFQCDAGVGGDGSDYFMNTLYRVYIQGDWCDNPDSSAPAGVTLMSADTVFIFVLTTLVLSVATFAMAIVLLVVVIDKKKSPYIFAAAWVYFSVCFSGLVVDLVLAIFLGIDFSDLTVNMNNNSSPGIIENYSYDVLRMGTQLLIAIALKGYLAPVISSALIVLLLIYAAKYRNRLQTEDHSIHKRGAINAYELQKREDAWQNHLDSDLTFTRGQHLNPGFVQDEPRRSPRSPRSPRTPQTPMSDYSNREYDRSDSWHHQARPFSYMEEPRRHAPSPAEPRRREPWPPAPPVPAPDYSPPARRLKSALKPNYM